MTHYVRKGQRKACLCVTFVLIAMLSGCSGIAVESPSEYIASIPIHTPPLPIDGVYHGSYFIALPAGAIAIDRTFSVDVTVISKKISNISIEVPSTFPSPDFESTITQRVLASQSVTVDAVSGATFSSEAFLKAVENALEK